MNWRLSLVACSLLGAAAALGQPPTLTRPSGQGVASENATVTREALQVLQAGGSAADAAITAALVAGVTAPTSSGLGGGGFALLWDAKTRAPWLLDFRETAPAALDASVLEQRPLAPARMGHLVGVPGEGRGLFELHRRAGKLAWANLVQRAEKRARQGYLVSPHLGAMLRGSSAATLTQVPGLAALFFPGGKAAAVGVRVVNLPLAETLKRLAAEGPEALYGGAIANEIVEVARAHGGTLTLEDMARYQPIVREVMRLRYEGYDVLTMPLPSAGGLMLAEVLRLFPAEELRRLGFGTPAYRHLIAEGLRGAIADRMRYLGDGDHEKVDLNALLDERRLGQRRTSIALDRTHALPRFGLEGGGTHHLVTSDRQGNVVSLTTTVNRLFGAKLMAEKSGIVLNDQLDDFTSVGAVAPFGMTQSPNRPRALARPLSSMTPTLVLSAGQPLLALGGSGGPAISQNVVQVLLGSLVFGQEPAAAVAAPRIYVPTQNATLMVETTTSAADIADLEQRGEIVAKLPFNSTAVQVLRFDAPRVRGGADPRKHGEALAE